MRVNTIYRKTAETDIKLTLNLDGKGVADISTGCGFFDHMLTLFCVHSGYDLSVKCDGDIYVDYHHTVEDVGICLGNAFFQSVGDKKGIIRYGSIILPMDEALILSAVDISGRGMLCFDAAFSSQKVGDFDAELSQEFFIAFAREAGLTLHIKQLSGCNTHHIIEGMFKSVARSLSAATAVDAKKADIIPSTKGVL